MTTTIYHTPTGIVLAPLHEEQACPTAPEPQPHTDADILHQTNRLGEARYDRDDLFRHLARVRAEVDRMARCLMAADSLVEEEERRLALMLEASAGWKRRVGCG